MTCRRPITTNERQGLIALGHIVREHRTRAHLTRADLAVLVGVHPSTIERIEYGTRRTRGSTLEAIARAIADTIELPIRPIVRALMTAARPVLAPESEYADRIARRRARRYRKAQNAHEQRRREAIATEVFALGGLLDWVLWDEYQRGERDWLPRGHRLRGTPEMWMGLWHGVQTTAEMTWHPPALATRI